MIFGRKDKIKHKKCENCGAQSDKKYHFCPFCGNNFTDEFKERQDFGLLGRNDFSELTQEETVFGQFGISEKMINSLFNNLVKNLDKQFRNQFDEMNGGAEVRSFPNGIKIKISGPIDNSIRQSKNKDSPKVREIHDSQLKKMNLLPREKAKANVKRLGNKIVYELSTPGVVSPDDVFISKLESGYEIKAIGDKKIYVNSVPINLPLKNFSISDSKLSVEFAAQRH